MTKVEIFALILLLRVNTDGRKCAVATSVGRPDLIQCSYFKLTEAA